MSRSAADLERFAAALGVGAAGELERESQPYEVELRGAPVAA